MDRRRAWDFHVSPIGLGTYLGAADDATDARYSAAIGVALEGGVDLIDTSLNYRHQRSERAVGEALERWLAAGHSRDEVVVCTKAGYLVPDAVPAGLKRADTAGGIHCLQPHFLEDQLERSLRNLRTGAIDIWYLHNPETQIEHTSEDEFWARMRKAFEFAESAAASGRIRCYGVATWEAFRRGAESVSLRRLERLARDLSGPDHRFRFVQLPFNLAMTEAYTKPVEDSRTVFEVANDLGINVIASASILQSRLSRGLPEVARSAIPGFDTDAQRSIQFVRSCPGVVSALVGMSDPGHVRENLAVLDQPPLPPEAWRRLFG